jgi:hypothetical protein
VVVVVVEAAGLDVVEVVEGAWVVVGELELDDPHPAMSTEETTITNITGSPHPRFARIWPSVDVPNLTAFISFISSLCLCVSTVSPARSEAWA